MRINRLGIKELNDFVLFRQEIIGQTDVESTNSYENSESVTGK